MRNIWCTLIFCLCASVTSANDGAALPGCSVCENPIVTSITGISTSALVISWYDPSFQPGKLYEIETVPFPQDPTGFPTIDSIDTDSVTIEGLLQGTAYDIFVRAICDNDSTDWIGPLRGVTRIDNSGNCQLNLPIDDNNCPETQEFLIDIDADSALQLGMDVFVQRIDMIIEHPWLADLSINLVSPSGQSVLLSSDNGVSAQDFGDPSDSTCVSAVSFAPFACQDITGDIQNYTGLFLPEEPLGSLYDSSSVNGAWKLRICDKASDDIGALRHVMIHFTQTTCELPPSILLLEEMDTSAFIMATDPGSCDSIEVVLDSNLMVNPANATFSNSIVCPDSILEIGGLEQETSYVLYARKYCGNDTSQWSCPLFVTTACSEISLRTDFDQDTLCEALCDGVCTLSDTIWTNSLVDDHEWLVFTGPTPTNFTGPDDARTGIGNYLYTETSGQACTSGSRAILISRCLRMVSPGDGCDMTFWYHMYGDDIGALSLEASTDEAMTWATLWSLSGNQGNSWKEARVSLSSLAGTFFRIRFVAETGSGFLGDIALDELTFHGTEVVPKELTMYYLDADNDTYGVPDSSGCFCTIEAPDGFSIDTSDCDDSNPAINPGADELPCNLIDDNCNMIIDEGQDPSPVEYIVLDIDSASCPGIDNGSIGIQPTEGTPPFSFDWGLGIDSSFVSGLSPGAYQCTITDANGCIAITDTLIIGIKELIIYATVNIENPDCPGVPNGSITGNVLGGKEPMTYLWNTGDTTLVLDGIDVGTYQLTITDSDGCRIVSDEISVTSSSPYQATVIQQDDVSCFGGSDGVIQIVAPGAAPPVEYLWSNGDTTPQIQDLEAGVYVCTVTDANGCRDLVAEEVSEPAALEISVDALEPPTCYDGNDGTIQLTASGGTPPYFYQWNTQVFEDDLFSATAGMYSVTVSDINGCQKILDTLELAASPPVSVEIDMIADAECPADSGGLVSLNVTGGMPDYSYSWNVDFPDTGSVSDVLPGVYAVTVTDIFGCKGILRDIQVLSLDVSLEMSLVGMDSIRCHGDSTGVLRMEVLDGKAPYRFNWSIGQEHLSLNGIDSIDALPAGTFSVTVTDDRGCIGMSLEYQFDQPPQLQFRVDTIFDNTCNGDSLGLIEISNSGGTPPYMYLWSDGSTDRNLTLVPSGLYRLTITDANLCTTRTQWHEVDNLSGPADFMFETMDATSTTLGWAEVFVSGLELPLSYIWDEGAGFQTTARATNLPAGIYSVSVTDAFECTYSDSTEVMMSTSVSGIETQLISIYPNPNTGQFVLSADFVAKSVVAVDMFGRQVPISTYRIDERNWRCILPTVPAGMYLIVVDGQPSGKMVIE